MKYLLLSAVLLLLQCEDSITGTCGCDEGEVIEELNNQTGTISKEFNSYMIIPDNEEGRLFVCNGIADSLKVEGILVKFSGKILKPCPNVKYNGNLFELTQITTY